MLWSQKSDIALPNQWLQVQIRTLDPRSWNRGHFHGLFLANLGSRTSFPAGSFEISPAPSTRTLAHSFSFSSGISWNWRRGEKGRGGRSVCGVWALGTPSPRPPFIALLRQYPPQQKSRHGSTDRQRPTAANRKASPLSLLPLLSFPCGWKARSSDFTLVVHAGNNCTTISL